MLHTKSCVVRGRVTAALEQIKQTTRSPGGARLQAVLALLMCLGLAAAGAHGQESDEADPDRLFLRVTVHEPAASAFEADALYVKSCFIGGRGTRANRQDRQRIEPFEDQPGGRTGWFALPPEGDTVPYSGVTIHVGPTLHPRYLSEAERNLDRIEMTVELAVAKDSASITDPHALRRITARGNGVPFYYTAGDFAGIPGRAGWLMDHLKNLRDILVEAGYDEPVRIDPSVMRLGINLSNHRFGAGPYGMLSRDPKMYELYGEIFALAGYNIGTRGRMAELYENHPQFAANMVEVAESSRDLPPDYLPEGMSIPEAVDRKYRQSAEQARQGDGRVDVWMKLGDEIGVNSFPEEGPWRDRAMDLLRREARIVTGDDPRALGLKDWRELKPVLERDPGKVAEADRLRYYITVRARNVLTAERYAARSAAIEKHFGSGPLTEVNMLGPMYYGGYSKRFWYQQTPDYFRMGELGSVDVLQVHGIPSGYDPGGSLIKALLSPKITAQAAERHERVEPELMHFAPRSPSVSWPHAVFAGLASGVRHIDWYRFGPRASGWEWFDDPDAERLLGHAALARELKKVAPYLTDEPVQDRAPRVALLWAESSDLWQRHPNSYSKSELRPTFMALRLSGVPADFLREYMVEAGTLDQYDLLFVSQRNVNRQTQRAILDWVRQGGQLVLTPGAMTRDEADRPTNIVAEALSPGVVWRADEEQPEASGEFGLYASLGELDWQGEANVSSLPLVYHTQVIAGEAEPLATSDPDAAPVNWSPRERGGTIEKTQGSIGGGAGGAFNPKGGGAWIRTAEKKGHRGTSTIVERRWDEPVSVSRIAIELGNWRRLQAYKFHYLDPRTGQWRELKHVDHGAENSRANIAHDLDGPVRTEAMRFEVIRANATSVFVTNLSYMGPAGDADVERQRGRRVLGRRMALGQGRVTALGFFPGHAYATGAARLEREGRVEVAREQTDVDLDQDALVGSTVRTGSPYWMEPNQSARAVLMDLVEGAGIAPRITVDAPTVDAGVHVQPDRAVILLANFQPKPRGEVTVQTQLPSRFRHATARDLSGEAVQLDWRADGSVRAAVNLDTVQAILIDR